MIGASTVHYRCSFDLRRETTASWSDLPKLVRGWISSKTTELGLGGKWFFEGGRTEIPGRARLAVTTAREIGAGTDQAPEFWSARFEHPCSEVRFRQWVTDIGLTTAGHVTRFSLLNRHWIRGEYIGEEPEAPAPSAPGLVSRALRAKGWLGGSQSLRLTALPLVLKAGAGAELQAWLEDAERDVPIILVTRQFGNEATLVDARRLARLLAGAAMVVEAESAEVNKELEWVLPKFFRCWDGMVRVYQPKVDLKNDRDSRRHRFFSREQIDQLGGPVVEKMLVVGVARRSGLLQTGLLTTVEDVAARQRERRLNELRQRSGDQAIMQELAEALEADNKALLAQVAAQREEATLAQEAAFEQAAGLEQARDDLQRERDYWKGEAQNAKQRASAIEKTGSRLDKLKRLPRTLIDMIDVVEGIHGSRIGFTERARRSAEKARANSSRDALDDAWECLWLIATVLPRLAFQQGGDLEGTFKKETGVTLTLTEGQQTKKDQALMRLRRDVYAGKEIDISAHVKSGRDFRIYFALHHESGRVVVGHCGDHLDTAGTRRM